MYTKILVDVSNMYHRCFHASKTMTTTLEDGSILTTGGIQTAIRSVQKLERDLLTPNGSIFFLCDATHIRLTEGDESIRKRIDPEYKANRTKNPDPSFYRGLDHFILALTAHRENSFVIRAPGYEADDMIAPTLENFIRPEDDVLLVSTDMDWGRYISPNTTLLRPLPQKDEFLTEESFTEKYGFVPSYEAIRLYKTFRGDDSDHIPIGLPYIGEDLLLRILKQFTSLEDFLSSLPKIDFLNSNWKNKIVENVGRLRLNWELVGSLPISDEALSEAIFSCSFEPKKLIHIYRSLGFQVASLDPRLINHLEVKKSSGFFEYTTLERV